MQPLRRTAYWLLVITTAAAVAEVIPTGEAASAAPATLTWSNPATVQHRSGAPRSISCPTRTTCVVVDSSGWATRFVHGKRSARVRVTTGSLQSVSCPTSSWCLAVGDRSMVYRYRSGRWSLMTQLHPNGAVLSADELDCASPRACVVASGYRVHSWNGRTWSRSKKLGFGGEARGVSCPTRRFCLTLISRGSDTWAWRYDGRRWSRFGILPHAGGAVLHSVSCSSRHFCAAVGEAGLIETYRHGGWSVRGGHGSRALVSVSCPSRKACLAVGSYGKVARWNGTRWRPAASPRYGRSQVQASCPRPSACYALDALGFVTRFNGHRWGAPRRVDGARSALESLACASPTSCFAADESGNVARFASGHWQAATFVDQHADPQLESAPALTCPSSNRCLLEDWRGYLWRWNGTSWSAAPTSPLRFAPNLACVSASWCLSIGEYGEHIAYSIFRGTYWSRPVTLIQSPGGSIGYGRPACASTSYCMVTLDQTRYRVFDGHGWSKAAPIASASPRASADGANRLVCPAVRRCVLDTYGGTTWVYASSGWKPAGAIGDAGNRWLSCAGTSSCHAADEFGRAYDFDGTSWTQSSAALFPPPAPDSYVPATGFACSGSSFCIATDGERIVAGS